MRTSGEGSLRKADAVMIYGASGYSGRAAAIALCAAGHNVVLAGRNAGKIRAVADSLSAPWRAFDLRDPVESAAALRGVAVVLNAAGPYRDTAAPMLRASLEAQVHYLDLSGEWPTFDDAQRLGPQAAERGVMLMPGVGLTIVGTDCLLAKAVREVPDATVLRVAAALPPVISRGTLQTALSLLPACALVRRAGVVQAVPMGELQRTFNFGAGERRCLAVNWPDVITGQRTTGVANIEAYLETPLGIRLGVLTGAHAAEVYGETIVRRAIAPMAGLWPEHPSREAMARGRATLVVEAEDPWRRLTRFGLRTLDGYTVTTRTAVAIVARVLGGEHPAGFQTPAGVFGADFIDGLDCAWPYDAAELASP